MAKIKKDHKVAGIEKNKRGNEFVVMDNPDDSLTESSGDNNSLMRVDSPDDPNYPPKGNG